MSMSTQERFASYTENEAKALIEKHYPGHSDRWREVFCLQRVQKDGTSLFSLSAFFGNDIRGCCHSTTKSDAGRHTVKPDLNNYDRLSDSN